MVLTDMVMSRYRENPEEWKKVKGILTTLSEDVDKVADNLAEKILQNRKQGARLVYSSPVKLMVKMMRMMLVKKDSKE